MAGKSKQQPIFFSFQLLPAIEDVSVVQMLLFDNVSQISHFSQPTQNRRLSHVLHSGFNCELHG